MLVVCCVGTTFLIKLLRKKINNKGGNDMDEKIDVLNELGEFTGKVATLQECHSQGYWHRAVYAFIIDQNSNVLLQKRSKDKKLWPGKWDVTVGGHVRTGEFGRQAVIRECKEELGIEITDDDIKYIVGTTSVYNKNGYINNHYDECYLILKQIDTKSLKLQKEEVEDVKFFTCEDLINRINNNYDELTEKEVSWHIFKRILDSNIIDLLN